LPLYSRLKLLELIEFIQFFGGLNIFSARERSLIKRFNTFPITCDRILHYLSPKAIYVDAAFELEFTAISHFISYAMYSLVRYHFILFEGTVDLFGSKLICFLRRLLDL
jgi:hypothetical protein